MPRLPRYAALCVLIAAALTLAIPGLAQPTWPSEPITNQEKMNYLDFRAGGLQALWHREREKAASYRSEPVLRGILQEAGRLTTLADILPGRYRPPGLHQAVEEVTAALSDRIEGPVWASPPSGELPTFPICDMSCSLYGSWHLWPGVR